MITSGTPQHFSVNFDSTGMTAGQVAHGNISIPYNDASGGFQIYTCTVTVRITDFAGPEINLRHDGGAAIPNGTPNAIVFGNQRVRTPSFFQYVDIENTGSAPLTVKGISIADAADFDLSAPVTPFPIGVGANASTFTLRFKPQARVLYTGVKVTVTYVDATGMDALYQFTVSGQGTGPRMEVWTTEATPRKIPIGDYSPPFGPVDGSGKSNLNFSIRNTGNDLLRLLSNPPVAISGSPTIGVTSQPTTPVTITGSVPFTVTYTPAGSGTAAAVVSIANDDPDLGGAAYTFTVTVALPVPSAPSGLRIRP
jgi:hypothetical protein